MKTGTTVSSMMHIALIAGGLVSIKPTDLQVLELNNVQIDVEITDQSNPVLGDREAPQTETPTVTPTEKPEVDETAENVGETDRDQKSEPDAKKVAPVEKVTNESAPSPKAIEAPKVETKKPTETGREFAALPESAPAPVARPRPAPSEKEVKRQTEEDAKKLQEEKAAVDKAAADKAAEEKEIADKAAADKAAEEKAAADKAAKEKATADKAAKDKAAKEKAAADKAAKAKAAKAKAAKEKAAKKAAKKKSDDNIKDLLNKQDKAKSGKKRSTKQASLGTKKGKKAGKLSRGEHDALRGRLGECWEVPTFIDQENLRVVLHMQLTKDGVLSKILDVKVSGVANNAHVSAIRRGLKRSLDKRNCQFTDILPASKYETWREVRVNYDPNAF